VGVVRVVIVAGVVMMAMVMIAMIVILVIVMMLMMILITFVVMRALVIVAVLMPHLMVFGCLGVAPARSECGPFVTAPVAGRNFSIVSPHGMSHASIVIAAQATITLYIHSLGPGGRRQRRTIQQRSTPPLFCAAPVYSRRCAIRLGVGRRSRSGGD
jgi:hypothetical protein